MNSIKIKCPAKINLTLEIVNKREDGFHNIKSIMQTINLYDYLHIELTQKGEIELDGNSKEIPYNEKNLVYKACELFFNGTKQGVKIFIEKNIPIAAGLAGGSTDAAGTLYGLNKLCGEKLSKEELHNLCAKLGSDLNVCMEGGCLLAEGRGEKITKLPNIEYDVTLIKPKYLGISAKEAYTKYAQKTEKPKFDYTEKMIKAIKENQDIKKYLYNDLEYAIFDDYKELKEIKQNLPQSIMSGSGSTYFVLDKNLKNNFSNEYQVIQNLNFVNFGVSIA